MHLEQERTGHGNQKAPQLTEILRTLKRKLTADNEKLLMKSLKTPSLFKRTL